jgi:hypothetical protein
VDYTSASGSTPPRSSRRGLLHLTS